MTALPLTRAGSSTMRGSAWL